MILYPSKRGLERPAECSSSEPCWYGRMALTATKAWQTHNKNVFACAACELDPIISQVLVPWAWWFSGTLKIESMKLLNCKPLPTMEVLLSWGTETDSNLIPARIPCRQSFLLLGVVADTWMWFNMGYRGNVYMWISPIDFWNYSLFYQFCAKNNCTKSCCFNQQIEENPCIYCTPSSNPSTISHCDSIGNTGPPWAQSEHTLVGKNSTVQPVQKKPQNVLLIWSKITCVGVRPISSMCKRFDFYVKPANVALFLKGYRFVVQEGEFLQTCTMTRLDKAYQLE